MTSLARSNESRLAVVPLLGALTIGLAWPLDSTAQDQAPATHQHKPADEPASTDKNLSAQLHDLQAKIARIEAALKQGHQSPASTAPNKGGMGGKSGTGMKGMGMREDGMMMGGMKKGMGGLDGMKAMMPDEMMGQMMQMMGQMMQMMGQMQANDMSSMGDMSDQQKMGMGMGMGMDMMHDKGMSSMGGGRGMDAMEMMAMMGKGRMGDMGANGTKMRPASALPGFPGVPHIYHIGATGFFLDHIDRIKLTTKQQETLNGLKEKALREKSTTQHRLDEAEQELWTLTATDEPDSTQVQAKVREIEKLRSEQRLAFIRSVGQAANVLTAEQRQIFVGMSSSNPTTSTGHQH